MNDIKSNKKDLEDCMRCIDIMHKQIQHIIVILVEFIKTSLSNAKESQVSVQGKRMYVLQQAMKIISWIGEFDPQNVNSQNLHLPSDLKQINDHTRNLMRDFPTSYGGSTLVNNYNRLKQRHASLGNNESNNISGMISPQDSNKTLPSMQMMNSHNQSVNNLGLVSAEELRSQIKDRYTRGFRNENQTP